MIALDPIAAARSAIAAPGRPATAVIHDAPDVRLVVFRLAPGQSVPPHRNASSVVLSVLAGVGVLEGEASGRTIARDCVEGDAVTYAPNELHAMRAADDTELLLLAAITPRPGSR
jgi:quercetin dioxygenase-like cupin family protein